MNPSLYILKRERVEFATIALNRQKLQGATLLQFVHRLIMTLCHRAPSSKQEPLSRHIYICPTSSEVINLETHISFNELLNKWVFWGWRGGISLNK